MRGGEEWQNLRMVQAGGPSRWCKWGLWVTGWSSWWCHWGLRGLEGTATPSRVCIKRPGCVFLFIDLLERETPKGLTSGADTPLYEMTSEGETPRWVDVKRGYPLHFHGMTWYPPSDESIKFSAGQIWKCSSTSQRISEKRHYLYLIQLFFNIVVFKLECRSDFLVILMWPKCKCNLGKVKLERVGLHSSPVAVHDMRGGPFGELQGLFGGL